MPLKGANYNKNRKEARGEQNAELVTSAMFSETIPAFHSCFQMSTPVGRRE